MEIKKSHTTVFSKDADKSNKTVIISNTDITNAIEKVAASAKAFINVISKTFKNNKK